MASPRKELFRRLEIDPKKRVDRSSLDETTIESIREINPWFLRDLISVLDIRSLREVEYLFATAAEIKSYANHYRPFSLPVLKKFLIITMFYEPSTRTRLSFESAAIRLQADVVSTSDAKTTSSSVKGEKTKDSSKVISHYPDLIIMRHPTMGESQKAADAASVPVINAGDGEGEHPTQALLDLFTITEKLGNNLNGKVITFVGDMFHSRTVHSLALLLRFYPGVKLVFVSPKGLSLSSDAKKQLDTFNISYEETENFEEAVSRADILYITRIQKERFPSKEAYEKYAHVYCLDAKMMQKLKTTAFVLHPLPRVDEIAEEVDDDPRALYFRDQGMNGLYVRMALLLRTLTIPIQQRKDKKWKEHKQL